jgi:uncharacterized protein (TIGR03435 family)
VLRAALILVLVCGIAFVRQASPQSAPASQPAFDAITIKPPAPNAPFQIAGFYGYPGGRVFFGGNVKALVEFAFNLQGYQVAGGPDWAASQWFEINAIPPETSPTRNIKLRNAEPTSEQRLLLQSLLRDRFGLKYHIETKEGEVYLLSHSNKELQLKPPKDPAADPRAIVMMKQGGIADGEALGINTTTDYFAQRLGYYLHLPVLNQTGIAGSYDYDLPPVDPENHDVQAAVLNVVDRLGLKIKRGRGPIQTLIIDHVDPPTEN